MDLLIAEDEKIERDYLNMMIDKADLPIEHIYLASNGQEAVDIYKEHPCELILMDINMPIKSGLEALKEIRGMKLKDSICFILTSYDYFSYAKEAIRLHVEDFILKPADIRVIIDNLSKAVDILKSHKNQQLQTSALVEKINHTKPFLLNECAHLILTGQDEVVILQHLKLLNIQFRSGFCVIVNNEDHDQLYKAIQDIEDTGLSVLKTEMKHDIILFIIANHEMVDSNVDDILQIFQHHHITKYGIGSIQQDLEQLYSSYTHAIIDKQKETKEQVYSESKQEHKINFFVSEWLDHLENDEEKTLKEALKNFAIECMQKEKSQSGSGQRFLNDTIHALSEKLLSQYGVPMDQVEIHIDFQHPHQMIEMEVVYRFYNILRSAKLMKYQQLDHISKKAIDYIKENYKKQISLNDVAEALNVSPSYLSRMLSNNNEKSFVEILNDYRIKEAKKLIRQGIILKEVAFHVGFRSQSYFAKAFKKAVGMSPKEYRNLF